MSGRHSLKTCNNNIVTLTVLKSDENYKKNLNGNYVLVFNLVYENQILSR